MNDRADRSLAPIFLAIGAVVGIGLAFIGTFRVGGTFGSQPPPGIIAVVNDTSITMEEYGRALASFESNRRDSPSDEDRAFILERLIEEELLIQRGIDIGLADNDRSVRSAIVRSMIDTIVAENTARSVTDKDLRIYYEENRALFTQLPSLHVMLLKFATSADADIASKYLSDGGNLAGMGSKVRYERDPVVPDTLLPPLKLREYIGPSALEAVLPLKIGEFSQPIALGESNAIVGVINKEEPKSLSFDDVRREVEFAYRNRRDDEALKDYLQRLKRSAEISRADLDAVIE